MKKIDKIFFKYYSKSELNKIRKVKLLIIGCGGLGTNVANILTRTGFINFILVDFDIVKMHNLNRQIFFPMQCGQKKVVALKNNLKKINSSVNIKTINKKIDDKNLKDLLITENVDIIIEAVDNEYTKKFIFETGICLGKKVLCVSGIAGYGDCENIKIKRGKNFSIIGDMNCSVKDCKPLSPKVTAIAAIQADEVLRMVLNR